MWITILRPEKLVMLAEKPSNESREVEDEGISQYFGAAWFPASCGKQKALAGDFELDSLRMNGNQAGGQVRVVAGND